MISGIFVFSQRGDLLISRYYRGDVSKANVDLFRTSVIASKETGTRPPIIHMDSCSFMYTRHKSLWFVAVTRGNSNVALVLEFLFQKIRILKAYLGDNFDDDAVRGSFTLIYELFDETMDFGYPQNCSVDVLRLYINFGTTTTNEEEQRDAAQLTSQITGAIDWRREGIRYRKNEVYIDILESVNLLMSSNGNVLRNDVTGQVLMKSYLSGMPECKFGLNDKLIMDREANAPATAGGSGRGRKAGVEIDDCTFHRCVRLGKFDAERTITFIPPDGEFELMRYRVADNISLPFRVIPNVVEEGRNRVSINITLIAQFDSKTFANGVVIKVPTPPNTATVNAVARRGRARYEPEQRAIIWRIRRFSGGGDAEGAASSGVTLKAEVELIATVKEKPWARPPISLEFQLPMFASSGVHVRFLKVYDKSGYTTSRWVRYITRAGDYQVRI